jgi:hypothetical protein
MLWYDQRGRGARVSQVSQFVDIYLTSALRSCVSSSSSLRLPLSSHCLMSQSTPNRPQNRSPRDVPHTQPTKVYAAGFQQPLSHVTQHVPSTSSDTKSENYQEKYYKLKDRYQDFQNVSALWLSAFSVRPALTSPIFTEAPGVANRTGLVGPAQSQTRRRARVLTTLSFAPRGSNAAMHTDSC